MNENLCLFGAEESGLKRQLAAGLNELARARLYVGTSSWKYEGWLGSVYHSERYSRRGRFSKVRFERECLNEYAEVFHTVSGDFAFYQFPSATVWSSLFAQVPANFRFAFKAPEEITTPAFPRHPRYGSRAGQPNQLFLDSTAFTTQFLSPLEPFAMGVALIIFEFPAALASVFAAEVDLSDDSGEAGHRFRQESGHPFRRKAAGVSERSDAGFSIVEQVAGMVKRSSPKGTQSQAGMGCRARGGSLLSLRHLVEARRAAF